MPTHRGVKFDYTKKQSSDDSDILKLILLCVVSLIAISIGASILIPLVESIFPK